LTWVRHRVLPLVHVALAHLQPGVQTGNVRGRGRRELRGEFGDAIRSREPPQRGIVVGDILKETPTEAVQLDQYHTAIRRRLAPQELSRQGHRAWTTEQRRDAGRNGGEAIAVIGGSDERGIERKHGAWRREGDNYRLPKGRNETEARGYGYSFNKCARSAAMASPSVPKGQTNFTRPSRSNTLIVAV
jgi:hypothetical protein